MTPDEHNPECTDHAAQGHALAANAIMKKWKRKQKFCDDAPTPPTAAPTPALPDEVREAIDRIVHQYEDEPALDCVDALIKELAPLWPRPAAATADARELAKKCLDAYSGAPFLSDIVAPVAAVLAPVLARAAAAEAAQVAAERTYNAREAEINDLRAEVERLRTNFDALNQKWSETRARLADAQDLRGTGPDLLIAREIYAQLAAALADKERLDTLRRLMGYTQDGSNQTVKLFEDDATRDFFIMAGRRTYMGGELRDAIDTAREGGAK